MSTKTKNQEARGIGLLQDWIQKLGGRDSLSEEETQAYDEYYEILTRELTLEDLSEFFKNEVYNLHNKLREAVEKDKSRDAIYLAARIENYQAWIDYIEAPAQEKESLIEHITNIE